MRIPIVKIEHYPAIGNSSGPMQYITDWQNLKITRSSTDNKDSFSFDIINHRERSSGNTVYTDAADYSIQDFIKIYGYYKDTYTGTDSDHLLFAGFIDDVAYTTSGTSAVYTISGTNATDLLMNTLAPALFSGDNIKKVCDMIVDLIDRANGFSGSYEDRSISAELAIVDSNGNRTGGGYIWPTKSDGSDFPELSYVKSYTSIFTHLKTLASTDYTEDEDSGFMYYMDLENNLHFEPKKYGAITSIDEYESPYNQISKTKTNDGMVNIVLLNSGPDPNGNGTLSLKINNDSVQKYGAKSKYYTVDKISTQVLQAENTEPSGGDANGDYSISDSTNYPTSFEDDEPWYARQNVTFNSNTYYIGQVLNDVDEFKDYIRTLMRYQGNVEAQRMVDEYGIPLDSLTYEPEFGCDDYDINDRVNISLQSIDYEKELRVEQIIHTFKVGSGWSTKISMTEEYLE